MKEKLRSRQTWSRLGRELAEGIGAKAAAWRGSRRLARPRRGLRTSRETIRGAEAKLRKLRLRGSRGDFSSLRPGIAELVRRIREETERLNRNNVTRTAAYWEMFREWPELHWALLAHLVSRNGGWAMTDLKGEWLPKLLDRPTRDTLFDMLESCNALIFRDAYPQLKLYAESRRCGESRFSLLPAFGVSAFMAPFWERFWIDRDSATLTVALIVNEQHVVERKVVQDPAYSETVLRSIALLGQTALQLNQIVFPLGVPGGARPGEPAEKGTAGDSPEPAADRPGQADDRPWRAGDRRGEAAAPPPLAGRILERFADLKERIAFGKSLYAMLYGYPKVLQGAIAFAEAVPHSGSRADYWPGRFAATADTAKTGEGPGSSGRSAGREAIENLWYSPRLEDAWDDRPLGPVPDEDWLDGRNLSAAFHAMRGLRPPLLFDMTREHEFGQRKLQAAALAKSLFAPP
ncbi:hypothetical protein J19TS2_07020 [Cohnella xylanilytica]|uniref:DUF2515 family protein n=1 Tax=Cohnella xylanilytica TaxID=557555 RepID=UPI001B008BDA|nr:DUF2515 family protein [Cohnella xylanilytica]GIO11147.1 hypothetical protein J19TS2_07020 [Cohnella xylanilytica]